MRYLGACDARDRQHDGGSDEGGVDGSVRIARPLQVPGSPHRSAMPRIVPARPRSDPGASQSFDFAGHFCLVLPLLGPALQLRPPGSPEGAASTASAASEPGRWGLGQLRKLTAQLVTTLLFLGRHTVIHADLKPENILLCASGAGGRVAGWVVDFGNAVGPASRRRSTFRYADVAG